MAYTYDYPRPMLTADCIVESTKGQLLLIRRGHAPYAGYWALPGGFMEMDETLEQCAARELLEETSLSVSPADLTLVGLFSAVDRDPRGRTVSAAYAVRLRDDNQFAAAGDDAAELSWFAYDELPPLAFDHAAIIARWRAIAH